MTKRQKYKCTIIGDHGVGKTSILNAYLDKSIENPSTTLGIDFASKTVTVNDSDIYLTLWDTAGAERFHSLTASYLRDSDIVVVVYDLSQKSANIGYWMRRVEQVKPLVVGILGNKTDLTQAYSEDLQDVLFPWTRQQWNIVTGSCSSRKSASVRHFFKRCLQKMTEHTKEPCKIHTQSFQREKTPIRTCCS